MKYPAGPPPLTPDEPFFFLRGQDALAPYAVAGYAALLRAAAAGLRTCDPHAGRDLAEQADECDRIAASMLAWQAANRGKLPD